MKNFFRKGWLVFEHTVRAIEESPVPLWYFGFTFVAVTVLRIFLEFLEGDHNPATVAFYEFQLVTTQPSVPIGYIAAHFFLFYASLTLALVVVSRWATGQPVGKLFKLICSGFLVTTIVPVIDLVLSGGIGYSLTYVIPTSFSDMVTKFFTVGGFTYVFGVSPGIQVEAVLIVLFTFGYARLKKLSVARSVFGSLAIYATIFAFGILPWLEQGLFGHFFATLARDNMTMIRDYALLLTATLLVLGYERKALFLAIARDLRIPRLLHYLLMFGLGILFVEKMGMAAPFQYASLQQMALIAISIIAAAIYSIITNNIEDVGIDRISNPSRPLVSHAGIDISGYKKAGWFALAVSLATALAAGFSALFFIALSIGNYFIYSMPPLRLKRVPLLSKAIIALNSLACFALGASLLNEKGGDATREMLSHALGSLPALPLFLLPIFIFFALNFLDLKDYEGDKKAGVLTLPVLMGLWPAKLFIAACILGAYIAAGFLFGNPLLLAAAFALGLIEFFLVARKNYRELPVFIPYLATLVAFFFIFR